MYHKKNVLSVNKAAQSGDAQCPKEEDHRQICPIFRRVVQSLLDGDTRTGKNQRLRGLEQAENSTPRRCRDRTLGTGEREREKAETKGRREKERVVREKESVAWVFFLFLGGGEQRDTAGTAARFPWAALAEFGVSGWNSLKKKKRRIRNRLCRRK